MSKTKKGFLTAGSILAIVGAAAGILISILLFTFGVKFQENHMVEIYKMEENSTYTKHADGSYVIEYIDEETGKIITITEKEIKIITKVVKGVLIFAACAELALDVAIIPIAIKLLKATNKEEEKKGLTISLLVMSILSGDLITLAFMIVALCLKNKSKSNLSEYQQITIE